MPHFSSNLTLPPVPDDVTLEQFILRDAGTATEEGGRPRRPESAPWLVCDKTGREMHLPEIRERTTALAHRLQSQFELAEDDVVFIVSSNHIYYPIIIWAVHRLCAIVAPCNPSSTVSELTYQLSQTRPSLIIAAAEVVNIALAGAQEVGIPLERVIVLESQGKSSRIGPTSTVDDFTQGPQFSSPTVGRALHPGEGRSKIAFFCTSSGTTGKPKIVSISHFSVIANVLQVATHNKVNETYATWEERRFRPGDVFLAVLPFYHIYGLVAAIHFMLLSGITVVVVPKFSFKTMLESIVRHKINQLVLAPPQVALLCKEPVVKNYDLSAIHSVWCAGAPLSAELNQQLIALVPNAHIGQAYGQTEATGMLSMWSIRTKHGFNAGEIAPGVIARVMKSDGTLADYNEPGELFVKTPAAALGYFGNEKATKETFLDGWIRTGDQVSINTDNEIVYIDRFKEIMKVRGFQVAPAELEGCILGHELVADVCVVGIPDSYSGEVPLAFVVPTAAASAVIRSNPEAVSQMKTTIMEYVANLKSPYKHIRRIEFVDEIPKNPSGKLLRRILRERARQLVMGVGSAKL